MFSCIYIYIYIYIYMCVCFHVYIVCVCVFSCIYIYIYIYVCVCVCSCMYIFFFFFSSYNVWKHVRYPSLTAAIQGDYTVSVAQGGTATPGATEQLLPPDRVFKKKKNLCIHKIN